MPRLLDSRCAGALLMLGLIAVIAAAPAGAADGAKLTQEAMARWSGAQYVFIGKLERVDRGPIAKSFPPIYHHTLHVTVERTLRGYMVEGDTLTLAHSARQHAEPTFPAGKTCIFTADTTRGTLRVLSVAEADAATVAEAERVCKVPLGWAVTEGKLLSPWAGLKDAAWPDDAAIAADTGLKCSVTGRPALLAGAQIGFHAEPVPPAEQIKWTNPDGDGEYRITVANDTDRAIEVPALLAAGDDILWTECLVILCQGKTYTAPGAKGVPAGAKPVKLEPGEKVSTTINALKLEGPEWPRGGYRIEFQFCLGEKSSVQSFYYMSRHHDKLRQKARQDR